MEIMAISGALPAHRHAQEEITDAFADVIARGSLDQNLLRRVHANAGVQSRHMTLPLEDYGTLDTFGQANDLFIQHAVALGAQALQDALKAADLAPTDLDVLICATATGLAIPSLDARIAAVLGLRPDLRRMPMVGLGCVAGAAGLARLNDYLVGHSGGVAALVTVELCSLTVQRDDISVPNLVGSALFGDGAAAVVARGGCGHGGPIQVLDSRSRLYPDTERTIGFDVSEHGLRIVLDAEVPSIVRQHVGHDVDEFLHSHGLARADIGWWVCHPGGPKVIDALRDSLGLREYDISLTRESLARVGNLSSASVLHILQDTLRDRPPTPGSYGLLMALGPGFCSELVLLRATEPEGMR